MSRTVLGSYFTLRSCLIILALLAATATPLIEETAWAAPPASCDRNAKGYFRLENRKGPLCVIAQRYVTVPRSGAVRMSAAAIVNDSDRSLSPDSRYFFEARIFCYDSGGATVFRMGASRNIWTGIMAGVYPASVFTAEPGRYLCTLQARQFSVGRASIPRDWYITPRNRTLSAAPFTYRGGTSSGPNMGPWPDAKANLTRASGTVTTASTAFDLPLGLSRYSATSTTPLSSCSFRSDISRGRMCSSIDPKKPVVAKVRLHAQQRTSPVDSSPCGPALIVDKTQVVDARTHHYGVVLSGTLERSLACTGRFLVRNQVRVTSGRGYIGAGVPNSTKRVGVDVAVGAGW